MNYKKQQNDAENVSPSKVVALMELGINKLDVKSQRESSKNSNIPSSSSHTSTNANLEANGEVKSEIHNEGVQAQRSATETEENRNHMDGNWRLLLLKVSAILGLLYFFVCSLDLLSGSFRLIAGKAAGEVFQQQKMLNNPIVGVMIGILVTVAVQSSSTSTSIVVSMVSSGLFTVRTAIPIVMGANIGTSVTNTIVALTHMSNREDFERAFAGSVLHDMFNLLAVGSLLILEETTGYLEKTTTAIVNALDLSSSKGADIQVLSLITKPLTSLIVQLDKNVIIGWSTGDPKYESASLLKEWCNKTQEEKIGGITMKTEVPGKCHYIFNIVHVSDLTAGIILLAISLVTLCGCLICLVKVLSTLLKGKLAKAVQRGVNANIPCCPCLTGYIAICIGAVMTILVQSSSVFTSAMTPLIAMDMISLERAYPLTLGSNLGTTTTAMLAALAAEGPNLRWSIQLALCHFVFNLTGIAMFYPLPFMRFPIRMARALGKVTARYRWFAVFYLIFCFAILPLLVFALSLIGPIAFYIVVGIAFLLFTGWAIIYGLQTVAPEILPSIFHSWDFLPLCFRSLEPYDRMVQRGLDLARRSCCYFCLNSASNESQEIMRSGFGQSSSGGLDNFAYHHTDGKGEKNWTTMSNSSDSPIGPSKVAVR